ncbi:hypothetical protein niasHS_007761 [Heterodera schachtii]|uniref:Uncharacterized protein n=1 Tax=Heterodera schachtii TaxID=97005 RepID=A0ABD2JPK2_HETSC
MALCLSSFGALLYSLFLYSGCSKQWEKPVMCGLSELSSLPENAAFSFGGIGIFVCEFICYLSIWAIIWCREEQMPQNVKKIIFSLSIIMVINLFCFIGTTVFATLIIPNFEIDMFALEFVFVPICIAFYLLANGSTLPVLCLCSEISRSAFLKVFR